MSLTIAPSPFGSLVVSVAETGSTLSVAVTATAPSVLTMALGVPGPAGATGATGSAGTNGTNGTNGVGVPVGGTTGQVLAKIDGTNYNTQWTTPAGGAVWGTITGTLSNQTDLWTQLGSKLSTAAASATYLPLAGGTMIGETGASISNIDHLNGGVGYLSLSSDETGLHFYGGIHYQSDLIIFSDTSVQTTAFLPADYLSTASAISTYQPLSGMSAYLSTAAAVSTYQPLSGMSAYQTTSAMSAYLSTASAASTYQPLSGMSAYQTTSAMSSYVVKTNNLSDLSNSTTARSNLGLGTASTSPATAFAQTANNLSDLSNSTTARSNLGLTSLASASFATTAEAQAGTSTTAVVNPSTLFDAKYFQGGKSLTLISWSTATSGTGATSGTQNSNGRLIVAPTSVVGYAVANAPITNNSRGRSFSDGYDFTKRAVMGGRFTRNVTTPDTNSVWRFSIGKNLTTATIGDLSTRGLMIKVSGSGALQLLVHNGTALTTTSSSFTPVTLQSFDAVVTSDGTGNAVLYVNGSSVATSAGAPTTAALASATGVHFETENTSTLTNSGQNVIGSDFFVNINT